MTYTGAVMIGVTTPNMTSYSSVAGTTLQLGAGPVKYEVGLTVQHEARPTRTLQAVIAAAAVAIGAMTGGRINVCSNSPALCPGR